jgi:sugar/nucleoside kinase (ribokinase family)
MGKQPGDDAPEYLIIGHITRDVVGDGFRPGGSVIYGALTASRLGARTALLTSCGEELTLAELEGVEIINQPSDSTTTFNNQYTKQGRKQFLLDRAADLELDSLPEHWRRAKIIHLAPVAREIDLHTTAGFPQSRLFFSLQGWLRKWDRSGLVSTAHLPDLGLENLNPRGAFLSIEDLAGDRSQLHRLRDLFPLLFLTLGMAGAELYWKGKMTLIRSQPVEEMDPTGAGDIFAAAFITFFALQEKPLVESALLASRLAGLSVTRPGIDGVPSAAEINRIMKDH